MKLEFVTLEILDNDEDEVQWEPIPLYLELPIDPRQNRIENEKETKRVIILDI